MSSISLPPQGTAPPHGTAGPSDAFGHGRVARRARTAQAPTKAFRIVLAIFIAVAVSKVQDAVPGLGRLYPAKLAGLALLFLAVTSLPRWQVRAAWRTTTFRCVVAIGILAVLSVPLSLWPGGSFAFLTGTLLQGLVLFAAVAVGFADRRTLWTGVSVGVLTTSIVALRVCLGTRVSFDGRTFINGTFDPNDAAALFVATLPFALLLASRARAARRWLWYGTALVLVAGLVKTGSRGGFLGLLVLAPWLLYLAPSRRRWLYVGALAATGLIFVSTANDRLWRRFSSTFAPSADYNMTSVEGRKEIWKRGIGYMKSHPLLGVGIDAFPVAEGILSGKKEAGLTTKYTAAHNSFVQIGAELGVFGLLAFAGALWTAGAGCRRVRRVALANRVAVPALAEQELSLSGAALGSLIGITTTGFFLSFAYHPVLLYFVAVCVGVFVGSPFLARGAAGAAPRSAPPRRGYHPARATAQGNLGRSPVRGS